jgi:hypothetical protein
MAKGKLNVEHLKNEQITPSYGVKVENTDMLDGMAKDSPSLNESNATVQYKTKAIEKGDLGGKNNPNG